MAKKPERPHYLGRSDLPPLNVGTAVVVLKPCIWSGASGVVESYDPATTLHMVRISGKNGETFRGEATREVLKVDYQRMLGL